MDLSDVIIFGSNISMGDTAVANNNQQQEAQKTNAETQASSNGNAQPEGSGFMGIGGIALYIVALIALFYFFAIRPQKKREKELSNIQNSINVGDWVMTSSGFYGKVVDIADQVFVVEFGTNKGVRIPVRKSEIIGNKEPNLTVSQVSPETEEKK